MRWIDATTEELGGIVVEVLGRIGYESSAYACHDPRRACHTVVTWRAGAITAGSKDVAVPDIIIPDSGGFRGGSGELSNGSRERIRGGGCVGAAVLVAGLQQGGDVRVGPHCYIFVKIAGVETVHGEDSDMLVGAIFPGRGRGEWRYGNGESKRLNIHHESVESKSREGEEGDHISTRPDTRSDFILKMG